MTKNENSVPSPEQEVAETLWGLFNGHPINVTINGKSGMAAFHTRESQTAYAAQIIAAYCPRKEEVPARTEERWIPIEGTEPPPGPVLLVVIDKHVQHMPAIWDGNEWTWLDSRDEDEPIPIEKITHWRPLPAPPCEAALDSAAQPPQQNSTTENEDIDIDQWGCDRYGSLD